MSGTKIRGITIELGGDTTGLSKALKDVNKDISSTQRQLKDVERLLKLDPGNTELLRQKQLLLNQAVEETGAKLESLKKAEKQVQEQFKKGEVSEDQYNALKREIIATEVSLKKLKEEAEKTEKSINRIDEDTIEDVAEAAREAEKSLKDTEKQAASFGDILKADAIVEGAKGIISSLRDVAEETKEYQKIIGSLEVSSERAGYTADETSEIYKKLYGVLADDQTAATTTANLQAMGFEQESLRKVVDATIGAWATYGDSIPIDGLAEAMNETAKTGKVTGVFADALNWAGMSEDAFNESLEQCADEAERANKVYEALASQGLNDAGNAWRENNKELVKSNEAQADMQENMAELGERVSPIFSEIQEGLALILEKALDLTEEIDIEQISEEIEDGFVFIIDEIIPKIVEFIQCLIDNKEIVISALAGIAGGLMALKLAEFATQIQGVISGTSTLASAFPLLGNAIAILTNPIFLVSAAVIAMVALIALKGDEIQGYLQKLDDFLQNIFAVDWTTVFGPVIGEALNAFMANMKNMWSSLNQILNGIIDFIRGVFTGDWERAWTGIVNIFGGIFSGLETMAKIPINGIIGLINGAISGLNILIKGANKIPGVDIDTIDKIPYLAKGGILSQGSAVVGEAGPELLTMMGNKAVVQPLTNQTTNHTELGGMNVYVYGAPGQDVSELADIIENRIAEKVQRRGAVFG